MTRRLTWAAPWLISLVAALAAVGLNAVFPLASALLVALVLGAIVTNTPAGGSASLAGNAAVTSTLLRVGVVLLGLKLPLGEIVGLGLPGLAIIVVTAFVTFVGTCVIGDRLGLDRGLVTLIAAGFSICGAAAIAAVEGAIQRRTEDVALAIAMVTVFGSGMIVALPLIAGAMDLSDRQTGVWAGASIHEIAQVIAAATTAGAAAVAIAITVKLGRVALLAVAYLAARRRDDAAPEPGVSVPVLPWFVIGFLVAAIVRTTGILPETALDVAGVVTTLLLAGAMFGLGLGLRVRLLFPVPPRVFVLAGCSTVVAASTSLGLTLALF